MNILSHKIRLKPNKRQATHFKQASGTSRFVFNWGLARWREMHEAGGKPSAFKLDKLLVQEKQTQYPWMSEVSKWVRQKALQDVEVAFRHFFRRVKSGQKPYGYPKFKKRGKCRDSFYINANHLRVEGRRIRVPYLGWVRMRQPLRFEGRVLSATFSREADQWFASIQVELDDAWDYPHRCENQAVVGLDFGLRELIVASDGKRVPCPRSFRRLEKKLKKANRRLVRRVKGLSQEREGQTPTSEGTPKNKAGPPGCDP